MFLVLRDSFINGATMIFLSKISDVTSSDHFYLNIALLFGLIVFGGALAARLFQKFRIPQVVGCVFVGILFGDILGLITKERIEALEPFMMLALGIIGFMIGGELRAEVFKKYGKQFFIILFSQGIGAFLLVLLGTTAVVWIVLPSILNATPLTCL